MGTEQSNAKELANYKGVDLLNADGEEIKHQAEFNKIDELTYYSRNVLENAKSLLRGRLSGK